MKIKSGCGWKGEVTLGVIDVHDFEKIGDTNKLLELINSGKVTWKRKYINKNKVTNYALNYIAQILSSAAVLPLVFPSKMELGTGAGTPSGSDTNLWTPSAPTMKACSNIQLYLSNYAQFITTWLTSDPITGTWTEAGLFDEKNNLWAHIASNITVNAGEMLVGQWQIQIVGN